MRIARFRSARYGTSGLSIVVLLLASCADRAAADGPPPDPLPSPTSIVAPAVRLPPVNARFDYQIGGAYPPAAGVDVLTRDRHDDPVGGRYNICYVNAFQTQPEEKQLWASRPELVLRRSGKPVGDPDWPGEYVLDTSTEAKRRALADLVGGWFADCAERGYQAAEPDNLDSWIRSHGLLNRADNLAFAQLLAGRAHAAGLAIAQKNAAELGDLGRTQAGLDFAVVEECEVYRECRGYTRVYGRSVLEIEYTDQPLAAYRRACRTRGRQISIILRDRGVVPRGRPGYHHSSC